MKNNFISISLIKNSLLKSLLIALLSFQFVSLKAQQYTENFNSAPAFTPYPGFPAWIQTATVTLGGTAYQFTNSGNGAWQHVSTGGLGNSANLYFNTAATTSVIIKRQDGKKFQFYGAWVKYTNYGGSYTPPWLRVSYEGSTMAADTFANNTTVALSKDVTVTSVTLLFSGLENLNFDNITLGPAPPAPPVSTTNTISIFSDTSATLGGSVSDDGGATVTESGVVYSTSTAPTIADNKIVMSSGTSSFSQSVTGLQSGTTYYVRSYATNSVGTAYGSERTFTTFGTFTLTGSHNFNTSWVSTTSQPSPLTKYVEGWNAKGESSGTGLISVNRLTTTNAAEGIASLRVASATTAENLLYMSMAPSNDTPFNLTGFKFRYGVKTAGTSFGTITVTGYKDGVAVAGAVQTITNIAPISGTTPYTTFTANANVFDGIDEFRLTASNSTNSARLSIFDIDEISVTAAVVLPVTFTMVKAYQQNAGIQVDWNVATESDIHHYEIQRSQNGLQFIKMSDLSPKANNYSSASYKWFDVNAPSGTNYYRIKSVFNSGEVSYSTVMKVTIGGIKQNIAVNPNPVTGTSINLQFNNQPKGTYTIKLFNNRGQQVYNRKIEHTGGSSSQMLDIKNMLMKGIYQLRISGASKSYTQQIIKD